MHAARLPGAGPWARMQEASEHAASAVQLACMAAAPHAAPAAPAAPGSTRAADAGPGTNSTGMQLVSTAAPCGLGVIELRLLYRSVDDMAHGLEAWLQRISAQHRAGLQALGREQQQQQQLREHGAAGQPHGRSAAPAGVSTMATRQAVRMDSGTGSERLISIRGTFALQRHAPSGSPQAR